MILLAKWRVGFKFFVEACPPLWSTERCPGRPAGTVHGLSRNYGKLILRTTSTKSSRGRPTLQNSFIREQIKFPSPSRTDSLYTCQHGRTSRAGAGALASETLTNRAENMGSVWQKIGQLNSAFLKISRMVHSRV